MEETDRRFVRDGVREWRATGRWRCSSINGRRSSPSALGSSTSTWPSGRVRRVLPRMDGLDTDRGAAAAAAAAAGEVHK